MFDWFKKKLVEYPDFYNKYLDYFEDESEINKRFVIFDCETTGLNPDNDRILSIGAVEIENQAIQVKQTFEYYLKQDVFKKETVKIHGLRKDEDYQFSEDEAIINFLSFIKNATLVGHHVNFDMTMINKGLERLNAGKLKNQSMDTNTLYKKFKQLQEDQNCSLDELAKIFKIKTSDRHTAVGDAFISAQIFLKLYKKMKLKL
jgi:DNA polymerase-3 subunit epsilon